MNNFDQKDNFDSDIFDSEKKIKLYECLAITSICCAVICALLLIIFFCVDIIGFLWGIIFGFIGTLLFTPLSIILYTKYKTLKRKLALDEIQAKGYNLDRVIDVGENIFIVDNKKKKWILLNHFEQEIIYDFSLVSSYEIYEDGNSVVKGSAGRALIGGAFFGITGAIIGGSGRRKIENNCNELKLLIRLNEINSPLIELVAINSPTIKDGVRYKNSIKSLQEICACFEYMINNKTLEESATIKKEQPKIKSKKEHLLELKELLDEGLITEEDFNKKKQEIL